MPNLPLYQVDAFTNRPFAGNPAGVSLLDHPRAETWMQSVAMEMNHSETAFLLCENDGYRLRWFTPLIEVDLCGHATLASTHILFENGLIRLGEEVHFFTRSGLLTAKAKGDWIEMNFPAEIVKEVPASKGMLAALGIDHFRFVGKAKSYDLVEVENEEDVTNVSPDFAALASTTEHGVIVTSKGKAPYDFISRFFAPSYGINEDPVTGSAHCILTPYWGEKLGKTEMIAYQASRRGGLLRVRADGERVHICGQAVTVFRGEIRCED